MYLPDAFYFTDAARGANPLHIAERLPANTGIIFRHYTAPDRASLAGLLAHICRRRQIPLFVASDAALAVKIGATGCHLPQALIPRASSIRRTFPQLDISAACHSAQAAHKAQQFSVDMIFLSPIYPTRSHPGAKTLTPMQAARIATTARLPVFALGGITYSRLNQIKSQGFSGFGAIDLLEAH